MRIGRAAWVTDTGRRRLRNEDAYIFEPPLFAIADGMGGARAGEIAAGHRGGGAREGRRDVSARRASRRASRRRTAASGSARSRTRAPPGMGTTVTVALVDAAAGTVVFGHVGDSRAYRLRDGVLEQITTDHSLVAELVESGVLDARGGRDHPQRSAITRALGHGECIEVDVFTVDGRAG